MRQSRWPRVPMAEHREPCESRGSRTVLGAPGGEIPPGDSTRHGGGGFGPGFAGGLAAGAVIGGGYYGGGYYGGPYVYDGGCYIQRQC